MSNSARNFTLNMTGFTVQHSLIWNFNKKDDRFKIVKFNLYYENCNDFEDWLCQLKIYYLFNSLLKEKKIMLTISYLHKRAQHWFKSTLHKYLNDNEDEESLFINFENFKKEIHCVFRKTNKTMTAVCIIQHLKQQTSTFNYTARFKKYLQLSRWDDETLIIMYHHELKDNVKNKLMHDRHMIDNLNELIKTAIKINNKLYKRVMKQKYDEKNHR